MKKNITLDISSDTHDIIEGIAKNSSKSFNEIVNILINEALENREDKFFSNLAESIDKPEAKTVSHEEAWKNIDK